MPTRTSYEHGTFSWADLATTDTAGAKRFYGGLFGWTFDDRPASNGMTYTVCKLGEHQVAALYQMAEQGEEGVPPHWMSYITVDDLEARTTRAEDQGGKVLMPPFDVEDVGRMSVIADPSGGIVALWKAKTHPGAGLIHEPGSLTWHELMSRDAPVARDFYVRVLGWETSESEAGPGRTYTLFSLPGASKRGNVGGLIPMPPQMEHTPSHWLVYFAAEDCDAKTEQARGLGATVLVPPMDIPNIGRFSVVRDPQGAAFSIYKNEH